MKRDYASGVHTNVKFFVGLEVEHTPAFGQMTLFVVDVQPVDVIQNYIDKTNVQHIFFGANHSFNPTDHDEWKAWEEMIVHFLKKEYMCSLDIPLNAVATFNDSSLNEYNHFIPQIRVPIPYVKLWNYNTMLKIDDKGFNATNPGVWCHRLHDLMSTDSFTDWNQYKGDEIIK